LVRALDIRRFLVPAKPRPIYLWCHSGALEAPTFAAVRDLLLQDVARRVAMTD